MAEGGWMVGSAKTKRGFGRGRCTVCNFNAGITRDQFSPLAARESAEFTFPRSRGNCKHADVAY